MASYRTRCALLGAVPALVWVLLYCCCGRDRLHRGETVGVGGADSLDRIWSRYSRTQVPLGEVPRLLEACGSSMWLDLALLVLSHPAAREADAHAVFDYVASVDLRRESPIWGASERLVSLATYVPPSNEGEIMIAMGSQDPLVFLKCFRALGVNHGAKPEASAMAVSLSAALASGRVYTPPEYGGYWSDYTHEPCVLRARFAIDFLVAGGGERK